MKEARYNFSSVSKCNMCGSLESNFKYLGKRLDSSQGLYPTKKTGITMNIYQCKSCSLIFSNPQPIPVDIQDHYGVPPEDYWKDEYFKLEDNYFKIEIEQLELLMSIKPKMKSLDIGAGLGKQMLALEKIGFEAHGFEPSKSFYERAISKMGISKDKLKLAMIEKVEYPKNYFDFISFSVVLEHLYDPSESINKALNWLKPGGIIHIEVPSSSWLIGRLINLVYKLQFSGFVGNLSPMHPPYHLYEFGYKSFLEHSKQHGYHIAAHRFYPCTTYLPRFLDYPLRKIMKVTNSGMQLSIWLRKD